MLQLQTQTAPSATPSSARLILVPPEIVDETWTLARPYLDRAAAAGTLETSEDWRRAVLADDAQLWIVWTDDDRCVGAGITYLVGAQGVCVIAGFGADNGGHWKRSLPVVEQWAKTQGCNRVRIFGRVGWMDRLKDYAVKGVILDKELAS